MKILLTGGSGQVGREFLARADDPDLLAPERESLDLARPESIRPWLDKHRPQIILSVGAYTAVDRAEEEPERAHAVNGEAIVEFARYCADHHAPLIHLSTDYVFDGSKPSPYVESDATAPLGVYGRSKFQGEQAARQLAHHLILRISWVFAAHGGNFLRTMLRVGAERDRLGVVSDQFGGPTWAGHVAQALHRLVNRLRAGQPLDWGTWHYGGTPHVSWHAFAEAIFAEAVARGLLPRRPEVEAITTAQYPTRAQRPANSRLDSRRCQEQLDLPAPDWREGLKQVLDQIAAEQAQGY